MSVTPDSGWPGERHTLWGSGKLPILLPLTVTGLELARGLTVDFNTSASISFLGELGLNFGSESAEIAVFVISNREE